jgi:hypothetical protein
MRSGGRFGPEFVGFGASSGCPPQFSQSAVAGCDHHWNPIAQLLKEMAVSGHETFPFHLIKRIIIGPDRSLAQFPVPFDCFPPDRIVQGRFPMTECQQSVQGSDGTTRALLDAHLDSRMTKPFHGDFANLRVIPTWPMPADEDAESVR